MKTKHLCVSFMPLYPYRQKGFQIFEYGEAEALAKRLDDSDYTPHVQACLWGIDEGEVHVAWLVERAAEIADNMQFWSDQKPEEWFQLHWLAEQGWYTIAAIPRVEKVTSRFRFNLGCVGKDVPEEKDISVLMRPLSFSGRLSAVSEQGLKASESNQKVKFHLIDPANFDEHDPSASVKKAIEIATMPFTPVAEWAVELLRNNLPIMRKCQYCGWEFDANDPTYGPESTIQHQKTPTHDFPPPCRSVCPGSGKKWRCIDDKRKLGKDNDRTRLSQ